MAVLNSFSIVLTKNSQICGWRCSNLESDGIIDVQKKWNQAKPGNSQLHQHVFRRAQKIA